MNHVGTEVLPRVHVESRFPKVKVEPRFPPMGQPDTNELEEFIEKPAQPANTKRK